MKKDTLAHLTPKQRRELRLDILSTLIKGPLSHRAIAEAMGLDKRTIVTVQRRALDKLAQRVSEEDWR